MEQSKSSNGLSDEQFEQPRIKMKVIKTREQLNGLLPGEYIIEGELAEEIIVKDSFFIEIKNVYDWAMQGLIKDEELKDDCEILRRFFNKVSSIITKKEKV